MPNHSEYDVLIVGAGLAGLTVALSLPSHIRIGIFLKDDIHLCASYLAQGGIAAVLAKTDTVKNHVENTLIAGAGLCHIAHTQQILAKAPQAIEWLQQQGIVFDIDPTVVGQSELHLTQEGGHDHRRIVHVADHTGKSVIQALIKQLKLRNNIQCLFGYEIKSIVSDDKHCQGVRCKKEQYDTTFTAKHTVLATGGLGQLFERTTNPITAQGDGIALAYNAGCRVANLEFIQFHPTGLAWPNANGFLISEALRGEGGVLRNAKGYRFMPDYDERAELAPRDVVARAISNEMMKQNHQPVFLDLTHLEAAFIQQHFPAIYAQCYALGLDICTEMIPVAPTVHYSCGGVLTDDYGRTDVEQLYAVGEVACTGLHGANRLASNSLLECVVVGRNIAQDIQEQRPWSFPKFHENTLLKPRPLSITAVSEEDFSHEVLRQWMSRYFGIVRNQASLIKLYIQLKAWSIEYPEENKIIVALLMVTAALNRKESRGAHFNWDYPIISKTADYSVNHIF